MWVAGGSLLADGDTGLSDCICTELSDVVGGGEAHGLHVRVWVVQGS